MKPIPLIITLLFILFSSIQLNAQGQQGLERIIVDAIPVSPAAAAGDDSLSADAVSYRIFVDTYPGYTLSVVTGTSEYDPTSINTSTKFYNHPSFGATKGEALFSVLFGSFPSLAYDSYISVGGIANDRIGVPLELDSSGYVSGAPIEITTTPGLDLSMFNMANSATSFYTEDGSWSGDPGSGPLKGPEETDSTIVMIGQFTTDGVFSFSLNIELKKPDGNLQAYSHSGEWERGLISKKIYQYTALNGVFGPGINPPTVTASIPYTDTIPSKVNVKITAEANDSDGTIDSVEFRLNGVKIGVDYTAPYEYIWSSKVGEHLITAVAIDDDGANSTSSAISITVSNKANNAPEVGVTNIANGQVFTENDNITIEVTATDSDDQVDSVEFFVDDVKIGSDLESPYSISWLAKRSDSVTIFAVATDNYAYSDTSEVVWIKVEGDNVAPIVEITSPKNLDTITSGVDVSIQVEAEDDVNVDSVEFYINDIKLGTDITAPYAFIWPSPASGEYDIIAVATDNDTVSSFDTIAVVVVDNIKPVIEITSPENNGLFVVGDTANILIDATDTDGEVDSVEFFVNGVKKGSDQDNPYVFEYILTEEDTLTVMAVATDNYGAKDTATISIIAEYPKFAPIVELTSPLNYEEIVIGNTVTIKATATDTLGVVDSVEFYLNDTKIGVDITSPYQVLWAPESIGTQLLIAKAIDDDNMSGSDTVTVKVIPNWIYPEISISSPENNEKINIWTPTNIEVDVSDSDGTIDSVEFFVEGVKVGAETANPFTNLWTPVSFGQKEIYAIATDNDGASTISDTITVEIKNPEPPKIEITDPTVGEEFIEGDVIHIIASATDSDGSVDSVQFFINNLKIGTDHVSPFTFDWVSASGLITIKATAFDNDGQAQSDNVQITVYKNKQPEIAITSPADSSVFTEDETVTLLASATDEDGTIDSVQFFVDNEKAITDVTMPYQYNWIAKGDTVKIYAKAFDNKQKSVTSDTLTIFVSGEVHENESPIVNITQPANNAVINIGANVTIAATASDFDGSISSVEFKLNSGSLIKLTTPPYTYNWPATNASNYTITAIAADNEGATATSAIEIEVVGPTGLNEILSNNAVKVFPNPVEKDLNLQFSQKYNQNLTYGVYDILGNKVKVNNVTTSGENIMSIDMSNLTKGIYLVTLIFNNEEIQRFKIIKK